MRFLQTCVTTLILSLCVHPSWAQEPTDDAPQEKPTEAHWAIKIGMRVNKVERAIPFINRVVLVPDTATYLDELSKWSPEGRWPVLIEDNVYAPMFVRRLNPSQVIRRESVGELPDSIEGKQRIIEQLVVRTFGGDVETESIAEVFSRQNYTPPGVVIASMNDPSWTAAAALAAGRAQPILWMNERFRRPDAQLTQEETAKLVSTVETLLKDSGYRYESLGDDVDAITMCLAMAGRATLHLDAPFSPQFPMAQREGPVAVTDLLGRDSTGKRFAFTGWIFGDEAKTAYIAMSSLFNPRDRISLINTYPQTEEWSHYNLTDALEYVSPYSRRMKNIYGDHINESRWQEALQGGRSIDVLWMNTKGNAGFFDLSVGRAYACDVPIYHEPVVLHYIHSWSLRSPEQIDTVGGRWLERGVYAMVGSCHEPMLGGFVTPKILGQRVTNFVPFLIAARWWDDESPFSRPWRIVTFGDPLMTGMTDPRAAQPRKDTPADYGLDLREHVKAVMKRTENDNDPDAYKEALTLLNLLGQDEVAEGLWQTIQSDDVRRTCARAALDPLFRRKNFDDFRLAWDFVSQPDDRALDMLWHLFFFEVDPDVGEQTLLQLQDAIRPSSTMRDIERLTPHLTKRFGTQFMRNFITRELDRTQNPNIRQQLTELLKRY